MPASLAPILVALVVAASGLWVLRDASRCRQAGSPVYLRLGSVSVETPLAWFIGCLVLWIFFFPLYLVSRSRA